MTAGAVPLIVYYLTGDGENVFYEPLSLTGWVLGSIALGAAVVVRGHWLRIGTAMVAGAWLATTAFVFAVGPGSLWPIAIVLGTMAAALPIAAGSALGALGTTLGARRK